MKDEITLSGNGLRKFAERVFDSAYKAALKQAVKQIEGAAPLTEAEYLAFRAKALAGFKVV
jgi:hypothetical protein